MLADRLKAFGLGVVTTREPGGSPGAEAIVHVVLSGAAQPGLGSHAEAILFAAARDDHVRQLIGRRSPAAAGSCATALRIPPASTRASSATSTRA